MVKVAIVDYKMGNIRSVYNAVKYVGVKPVVVSSPSKLKAEKIIIPGVGAFGDGVKNFKPFFPKIKEAVSSKVQVLGICLGMQMFFEMSEESPRARGLPLIPGKIVKIRTPLKIPQIGWNLLKVTKSGCPLFNGVKKGYVYFDHSYHASPKEKVIAATTDYGATVTAAVWKGNLFGTQFHPEKSGEVGLKMLRNFLEA
ncbi:MAG: imidazole glycerol phosphate synthase subunit HisH [Candidatus Hadarchaeota archaeon]